MSGTGDKADAERFRWLKRYMEKGFGPGYGGHPQQGRPSAMVFSACFLDVVSAEERREHWEKTTEWLKPSLRVCVDRFMSKEDES